MKTRDPPTKLTLPLAVLLTLGAAQAQADILSPVSIGFRPVGITMDQTAFVQTYPPAISTQQGQMRFGPLALRAGGASIWTEALSFQIVDRLAHQDDFWSNMLVGDANHNHIRVRPILGT